MSKEFSRISIEHLASWILREYDETSQIFGIHKDLFFVPKNDDPFTLTRYGQHLESPLVAFLYPLDELLIRFLPGNHRRTPFH